MSRKLGRNGEIELPREARRALGVGPGDAVDVEWRADGVVTVRRTAEAAVVDAPAGLTDGPSTASERGVEALRNAPGADALDLDALGPEASGETHRDQGGARLR